MLLQNPKQSTKNTIISIKVLEKFNHPSPMIAIFVMDVVGGSFNLGEGMGF